MLKKTLKTKPFFTAILLTIYINYINCMQTQIKIIPVNKNTKRRLTNEEHLFLQLLSKEKKQIKHEHIKNSLDNFYDQNETHTLTTNPDILTNNENKFDDKNIEKITYNLEKKEKNELLDKNNKFFEKEKNNQSEKIELKQYYNDCFNFDKKPSKRIITNLFLIDKKLNENNKIVKNENKLSKEKIAIDFTRKNKNLNPTEITETTNIIKNEPSEKKEEPKTESKNKKDTRNRTAILIEIERSKRRIRNAPKNFREMKKEEEKEEEKMYEHITLTETQRATFKKIKITEREVNFILNDIKNQTESLWQIFSELGIKQSFKIVNLIKNRTDLHELCDGQLYTLINAIRHYNKINKTYENLI